ncbi:MAG: hypothetical protein Q9191_001995 [Dirinaria sp. TL-2023a]
MESSQEVGLVANLLKQLSVQEDGDTVFLRQVLENFEPSDDHAWLQATLPDFQTHANNEEWLKHTLLKIRQVGQENAWMQGALKYYYNAQASAPASTPASAPAEDWRLKKECDELKEKNKNLGAEVKDLRSALRKDMIENKDVVMKDPNAPELLPVRKVTGGTANLHEKLKAANKRIEEQELQFKKECQKFGTTLNQHLATVAEQQKTITEMDKIANEKVNSLTEQVKKADEQAVKFQNDAEQKNNEIRDVRTQLQAKQDEIDKAASANKSLKEQHDSIKEQHDSIQKEYNSIKDSLDVATSANTSLQQEYDSLRSANTSLQQEFDSHKEGHDSMTSSNKSLEEKCSSLKEDYDWITSANTSLQQEYDSLKEGYDSMASSNKSLEGNYSSLKKDYDSITSSKKLLEKEYDLAKKEHDSTHKPLKDQLESAISSKTSLLEEYNSLKQDYDSVTSTKKSLENELDVATTSKKSLQEEYDSTINKLKSQETTKDKEIDVLNKLLESEEEKMVKLSKELEDSKAAKDALTKQINDANSYIESADNEMRSRASDGPDAHMGATKKIKDLEAKLKDKTIEAQTFSHERDELSKKLRAQQAQPKGADQYIATLERQNADSRATGAKIEVSVAELRDITDELKDEAAQVAKQIHDAEDAEKQWQKTLARKEREIKTLRSSLERAQGGAKDNYQSEEETIPENARKPPPVLASEPRVIAELEASADEADFQPEHPSPSPPNNKLPSKGKSVFWMLLLLVLFFVLAMMVSSRRKEGLLSSGDESARLAWASYRAGGGTGTAWPSGLWDDALVTIAGGSYA